MIDIKFSGNFDQELENLFQNLDEDKASQKIAQNFVSPYSYDIRSITSNHESQVINPSQVPDQSEPQLSPQSNFSERLVKHSGSFEKWHPWLFEEFYTLNLSKNQNETQVLKKEEVFQSQAAPLSPSKNKLNLNFTFTNEKNRKFNEDDFYSELQKKLEENTDDIKKIKENLDNFKGGPAERAEQFFSKSVSQHIPWEKIERSPLLINQTKRNYPGSKNEDFMNYLELLKNYKAEAIAKTLNFNRRKRSAIIIQKTFRGSIVRKAYRAIKTKKLMERCQKILEMKKKEYIQNNARTIIMKHMIKFVRKMKLRKKLIFRKFLNHCAGLIQRFFKYRVKFFYQIKKKNYLQKHQTLNFQKKPSQFKTTALKEQKPDFLGLKPENYQNSNSKHFLKNEPFHEPPIDNTAYSLEQIPQKKSFEDNSKIELPPRAVSKSRQKIEEQRPPSVEKSGNRLIPPESEFNQWEARENRPIGGSRKNSADPNKWEARENMPVGGKSKTELNQGQTRDETAVGGGKSKTELNQWQLREEMPVGGGKSKTELNQWQMREEMPVGGAKSKTELNQWQMREEMPIGGGKNKGLGGGFGEDLLGGNPFGGGASEPKKKPVKKHEFLKRNKNKISGPKEEPKEEEQVERKISEMVPEILITKPSESDEMPKSHFKNFSKNLSEINTQNLNNSMNGSMNLDENKELTNTLSALTYESPLKTNFKKKSQLFSPAALNTSERSTPSPIKQPFLKKKKATPKTVKKDERSISTKRKEEEEEEHSVEIKKEKPAFLKRKTAAVASQKLNWKKVSRTNCWLNKKNSPPESANKNAGNQQKRQQSNIKANVNESAGKKKAPGTIPTPKKGQIKETIMIRNSEDELRERILMMKNQGHMEQEYTASNFTLPENIPIIQINNKQSLQMRTQNNSDGSTEQNQLNQLIQMSSLDFRNTNANLSRIYKGSESSLQSVKTERNLAVDELERAYRTNYFGKLTSLL